MFTSLLRHICLFFSLQRIFQSVSSEMDLPPDVRRLMKAKNTVEYAKFFGYNLETHKVTTPDGYILKLHRLPNEGGRPVLFMHGLGINSIMWLFAGPETPALPYLYHKLGYDVYMGNARGTPDGRGHVKLNSYTDDEFWKFSWHEIGVYDVPAFVDYILNRTAHTQLSYVGMSQGGTVFFVMTASLPSYNAKIAVAHLLVPAVYVSHARIIGVAFFARIFQKLVFPYLGVLDLRRTHFQDLCFLHWNTLETCFAILSLIIGDEEGTLNKTMVPVYFQFLPVAMSMRQLAHYHQVFRSGVFAPFDVDYMLEDRPIRTKPYPLEQITAPVALYYAKNDVLVDVRDIAILKTKVNNLIEDYLIPNPKYTHLDPAVGLDVYQSLYAHLMDIEAKVVNVEQNIGGNNRTSSSEEADEGEENGGEESQGPIDERKGGTSDKVAFKKGEDDDLK